MPEEVVVPAPAVQELPLAQRVQELALRPVRALRLAPVEQEREPRPVEAELPPSQQVAVLVPSREVAELPLSQRVAALALSQQKVAVAEIRLGITVSHPDRVATLLAEAEPREAQPKQPAVAEAPA